MTRIALRIFVAAALLGLAACQTLPEVITTGRDTFDVRYDGSKSNAAEVDVRAAQICAGPPLLTGSGTRFDGFAFRSYRCRRRS